MADLAITFRDTIRKRVPRWLLGPWGYRFLYSMMVQLDAIAHATVDGIHAGFPGDYTFETLPLIGAQRRVVRGPRWSDATYAEKLRFWRQYHGTRGHAFGLLEAMLELLEPTPARVDLVYDNGYTYSIDAGGTITHGAGSWNWDADSGTQWSRFWVLLFDTDAVGPNYLEWVSDGVWGATGTWGDDPDATIGTSATLDDVAAVRELVALFTPPHAKCMNIIIVLDETLWLADLPSGDWDRWHNRNQNVAYWDGT